MLRGVAPAGQFIALQALDVFKEVFPDSFCEYWHPINKTNFPKIKIPITHSSVVL